MFIKKLTISSEIFGIIREINFTAGLNLIVDETKRGQSGASGNSVGKTTLLKIIDFCLGADAKKIYQDAENTKNINTETKEFLEDETRRILVELVLCQDINNPLSREVIIERNFLKKGLSICKVNGHKIKLKDFEDALSSAIFGKSFSSPSFRQLIAHNIRYTNERIENCLKFINAFAQNSVYEALHLYMFLGNRIEELYNPQEKLQYEESLKEEIKYREKLLSGINRAQLESRLGACENSIRELEDRRKMFTKDDDHTQISNKLSQLKTQLGFEQQTKNALVFRRDLINKNIAELDSKIFSREHSNLEFMYNEITAMDLVGFNKSFNDLVNYHNKMLLNKINFFEQDLPSIDAKIQSVDENIANYLMQIPPLEATLRAVLSLDEFEQIVTELKTQSEIKGELIAKIEQMNQTDASITQLREQLEKTSSSIYCESFKSELQAKINEFNLFFSKFSSQIYDEEYFVSVERKEDKQRKLYYDFSTFNDNFSSGKKMGEILSFDMAYVGYATKENIPCLKFIINDKKELMDINQIEKAGVIANEHNIQLIFSLLSDKLADKPDLSNTVKLRLSQKDKLLKF